MKYSEDLKQKVSKRYLELADAEATGKEFDLSKQVVKRILIATNTKLSLSVKKQKRVEDMQRWRDSMTEEEANRWSENRSKNSKQYWQNLSLKEREAAINVYKHGYKNWRENLTEEQKLTHAQKLRDVVAHKILPENDVKTWDEYFAKLAKERGITVLSSYIGTFLPMDFECPKHGLFQMRANNFQQGQTCPSCSAGRHESKIQVQIREFIQSFYPSASTQVFVALDKKQYEIDIYVKELNFGVELDGLMTHSTMKLKAYPGGTSPLGRHVQKA